MPGMEETLPKYIRRILPVLLAFLFLFTAFAVVQAQDENPDKKAHIYLFWGDGCPHCAEEKPILEALAAQYPGVELHFYEIWFNEDNQALLVKMADHYGFEPKSVPTTFIGGQYWAGYNEQVGREIEAKVQSCLADGCPNAGAGIITPGEIEVPSPGQETPTASERTLDLPLLGTINLEEQSLWISTAVIAVVDGFNPCSLWALSMLLALVLHTGSRRKIIIVGVVFLTVTSLVYVLFIAGLFSVLNYINYIGWVQVVVALLAGFFAIINIKDYFWYQEGVSLTISDKQKPGLFQKMRRVVDSSDSFWGLIVATIVLAAGVSLVEFSCTAGFPVLWTNLLTSQGVTIATFVALLFLYMFIYQLDELVIFMAAVFTLRTTRFEEKHGRILKLVGGMLMLTLAVVMLVDPSLMNSLESSLIIFGGAFLLTGVILVLHRIVLPKFGIYIGTREGEVRKRKKHSSHS